MRRMRGRKPLVAMSGRKIARTSPHPSRPSATCILYPRQFSQTLVSLIHGMDGMHGVTSASRTILRYAGARIGEPVGETQKYPLRPTPFARSTPPSRRPTTQLLRSSVLLSMSQRSHYPGVCFECTTGEERPWELTSSAWMSFKEAMSTHMQAQQPASRTR
jgi:hypothetical protein